MKKKLKKKRKSKKSIISSTKAAAAKASKKIQDDKAKPPVVFGLPCPTVHEAGVRVVHFLIGKPPQTITDIIESIALSRPTITNLLTNLIDVGYVEQTLEKYSGRGRPRYLFSATKKALRDLFESAQDIVFPAVWEAILHQVGKEPLEAIRQEVAGIVADYYEKQLAGKSSERRLHEMTDYLIQHGRLAEVEEYDDSTEVRILSCPFSGMVEHTGSLCRIHLLSVQKLVGNGLTVALTSHCNHTDQHCCVFLFRKNEKANAYPDQGDGI